MIWGICPTCNRGAFLPHTCPPLWSARDEEGDPDDWSEVRGVDAAEAAERFVRQRDRKGVDFTHYCVVLVRQNEGDEPAAYEVNGELVPEYHASALRRAGAP